MATMSYRATFALDESTCRRIRSLAALWRVSQAEVVRRAVALAEAPVAAPDPVGMLRQLHESGSGLARSAAEAYLAEVREARQRWRDR